MDGNNTDPNSKDVIEEPEVLDEVMSSEFGKETHENMPDNKVE